MRTSVLPVRNWALWRMPRQARRYVLGVEAVAFGSAFWAAAETSWRVVDVFTCALFAGCGLLGVELFHRVGSRHSRSDRPYHDLLSAFLFPAVLVLPPIYAVMIVLTVQAANQVRATRLPWFKWSFNTAMYMLVCLVAGTVHSAIAPPLAQGGIDALRSQHGLVALAAAAGAFLLVNKVLVVGVIRQVAPATQWRSLVGDTESWTLVVVEVCAGTILAVAWVVSPGLVPVALAPVMLLGRASVHSHLVESARTDAKTGLANPAWWRHEAVRIVVRARRSATPVGVLLVDLDRFKSVNDRYGHLTGDAVLAGVSDALSVAVRPGDLVGRFGGEEFVVALSNADAATVAAVGERVRVMIAGIRHRTAGFEREEIRVTASLGTAMLGPDGDDLEQLIASADAAMYTAKAAGGNCVISAGTRLPQPAPPSSGTPAPPVPQRS